MPGAARLDITVLICTRNRAAQLREALESAARMDAPEGLRWELLLIDNGSSDDTAAVAMSFHPRLPIRVVREDAAGLSHARNRGVAEALGAYICWTDDDVLIDRGWLAAYAAAFARHPDAAVFGGEIIPVLEAPTPRWFGRFADQWPLTTLLAQRNHGDQAIPLSFENAIVPWGANFAVRAAEQRTVGYEPGLGVSPLQRRVGEEAEAVFQIMKRGATGWWVPEARVRHIIPVKRQTWRYVYEYFQAYGETIAYMERAWPGAHHAAANRRDMARVSRRGPSLYARAALCAAIFAGAWLFGSTRRALQFLMRTGLYVGAARVATSSPAAVAVPHGGQRLVPPR